MLPRANHFYYHRISENSFRLWIVSSLEWEQKISLLGKKLKFRTIIWILNNFQILKRIVPKEFIPRKLFAEIHQEGMSEKLYPKKSWVMLIVCNNFLTCILYLRNSIDSKKLKFDKNLMIYQPRMTAKPAGVCFNEPFINGKLIQFRFSKNATKILTIWSLSSKS